MVIRKRGSDVGNKLWLGLLITVSALPLSAGIYIGTDATPPATYQSDANYPANVIASNNTAGQRNCRLYYDGKGPIPPLTCSPGVTAPMAAPTTTVKAPAPTPVVPIKNDQAAQQQPLAHVDTATPAPLTRPTTTTPVVVKPAPTPVVKPAPAPVVKPAPAPVVKPVPPPPPPKPKFVTTAMPGSLKDNVERIVAQSHWGTVVWNLPIDYDWNGTMTITADNVQGAIAQLLAHYPVQATFYDKNHIVSVEARRVI
jgi:hypothetical protein